MAEQPDHQQAHQSSTCYLDRDYFKLHFTQENTLFKMDAGIFKNLQTFQELI